jgi:hypothetical protein
MKTENKVSREVAIQEVTVFLKKYKSKEFSRGKLTDDVIEEDYIDVIEAIEEGLLVFDDKGKPKYTLRNPLYATAEDKSLTVTEVTFRARIKESDKNMLMDNLDIKKQMGTYTLKYISFITQLSMTEVKELEKDDFEVLNQICSVF